MPIAMPCRCAASYRPELPASQRHVAADHQQHLHEARIGGAPRDLLGRLHRIAHAHRHRRAQPRLFVQPLRRQPVVHRAGECRAHVVAIHRDRAVQAVQDADARVPRIERLRPQRLHRRRRPLDACAPVGPGAQRRAGRIGRKIEVADAARNHRLAPMRVQVRQQLLHRRRRGVQVAIDRPQRAQRVDSGADFGRGGGHPSIFR
jgi:hypothetical protein